WVFTGTPDFFDSRHGVAGLAPLHERIAFMKQGNRVNPRQPQLELVPFDQARLRAVALRLRELYPTADPERLARQVSDAFIERLVAEVTAGFKGDVGVVPRQFLREFVNQLDLASDDPTYDPSAEYGFEPRELRPEEELALKGQAFVPEDADDDGSVPVEEVF
ncbi:MAG TPA: BREX system ATP-binding domain-containing protein, partial [Nannocystis sp.]